METYGHCCMDTVVWRHMDTVVWTLLYGDIRTLLYGHCCMETWYKRWCVSGVCGCMGVVPGVYGWCCANGVWVWVHGCMGGVEQLVHGCPMDTAWLHGEFMVGIDNL